MVRSVLLYCAPIWGLEYAKSLEQFQIKYLKQLFELPKCTPHWFVGLEISIERFEPALAENALKFLLRILQKPKNSLVFKCYVGIKETSGQDQKN